MKPENTHPWQSDLTELFEFALEHFGRTDEISRRVSFLLLDVGVETLFKTYLTLPEEVTRTKLPYSERRKYTNGQFHDLLKGIRMAARAKIDESDLNHVEFYHDIRNNLYHKGNGITVRQDHVNGYATTATTLLRQLLDVDLTDLVEGTSIIKQEDSLAMDALIDMRRELKRDVNRLRDLARLFTEKIEPRLIYPSTVAKLSEIAAGIDVATFPSKLEELRVLIEHTLNDSEMKRWFLHLLSDDLSGDSPQVIMNTQFIMELGKDPVSFYLFLIGFFYLPIDDMTKDSVDRSEDISFVCSDDYHVVGIYDVACYLADFIPSEQYSGRLDTVTERSREVLQKLDTLIKKMQEVMKA